MGELKGVKELFAGRHFDREIIVLCVRWYLRYKLSLRDLAVEAQEVIPIKT
jgi:transposase-like protein